MILAFFKNTIRGVTMCIFCLRLPSDINSKYIRVCGPNSIPFSVKSSILIIIIIFFFFNFFIIFFF